jgi:hypothetical protein
VDGIAPPDAEAAGADEEADAALRQAAAPESARVTESRHADRMVLIIGWERPVAGAAPVRRRLASVFDRHSLGVANADFEPARTLDCYH